MSLSIVQLGAARQTGEGIRIGTVRRPPRGVPKDQYTAQDYFDVWFPNLAPTEELLKAVILKRLGEPLPGGSSRIVLSSRALLDRYIEPASRLGKLIGPSMVRPDHRLSRPSSM